MQRNKFLSKTPNDSTNFASIHQQIHKKEQ